MSVAETDPHADQLRLLEALLFAAAAPLDESSIAARLPQGSDIETLIAELTEIYSARGVNVVRIAGGWTVRTAPDLGPRLKLEQTVTRKPSRAAIETLAIIAYHQPVTRAEIEEIRGVVISKGTLDTLMEAGWVMPRGHRETPGRPATWVTTDQFLSHFGLADRKDLPGVEELKAAGLIGPRPDLTLAETVSATELPFADESQEEEDEAEGYEDEDGEEVPHDEDENVDEEGEEAGEDEEIGSDSDEPASQER